MVTFVGDVTWQQASEIVWSTDAFGIDTARIPYRGAVTGKEDFEATLVKFRPMASHPRMYFMGHSDDGGLIFPTVDLQFMGIKSTLPAVKVTNSMVLQTVTTSVEIEGDDGPENAQMEATYYASRTNYRWVMDRIPPLSSPYNLVQYPAPIKPVSYRINGGSGSVDYATFVSLLNNLSDSVNVSDYTREEIVPGKLWACESSVDYVLT